MEDRNDKFSSYFVKEILTTASKLQPVHQEEVVADDIPVADKSMGVHRQNVLSFLTQLQHVVSQKKPKEVVTKIAD